MVLSLHCEMSGPAHRVARLVAALPYEHVGCVGSRSLSSTGGLLRLTSVLLRCKCSPTKDVISEVVLANHLRSVQAVMSAPTKRH